MFYSKQTPGIALASNIRLGDALYRETLYHLFMSDHYPSVAQLGLSHWEVPEKAICLRFSQICKALDCDNPPIEAFFTFFFPFFSPFFSLFFLLFFFFFSLSLC